MTELHQLADVLSPLMAASMSPTSSCAGCEKTEPTVSFAPASCPVLGDQDELKATRDNHDCVANLRVEIRLKLVSASQARVSVSRQTPSMSALAITTSRSHAGTSLSTGLDSLLRDEVTVAPAAGTGGRHAILPVSAQG